MTMTSEQVRRQVMDYLEVTECRIIEQSPAHVTVKLSPQADRMLTDRPYYWGFVDRTGAEPETLSFTFVFDPQSYDTGAAASAGPAHQSRVPGAASGNGTLTAGGVVLPQNTPSGSTGGAPNDGLLSRYFGVAPMLPRLGPGLIRREDVVYGSKRLRQIWAASQTAGRCLYLFEDPGILQRTTLFPAAYEPWLAVCFKIELSCDLKRQEMHFIAESLVTGEIKDNFGNVLDSVKLTPMLPENIHIQPTRISLAEGAQDLERHIASSLAVQDYGWADAARARLRQELEILDSYYTELLKETEEDKKTAVQEQYESRRRETIWQYDPHISVSPVIYGLFHLRRP